MVENHFQGLISIGGQCDWGYILDCESSIVTLEMNEILTRNIEESEIKDAVFQMGSLKAPGPDGFQGVFYQFFGILSHSW